MPEQQAAAKADLVEQLRQHVERLDMHVVERPRQFHRRRCAIAGARIGEHASAGRGLKLFRKVAPQPGRAEALMQHHDGRRALGRRADHAVFEMGGADGEEAGGGKGGHVVCPSYSVIPDGSRSEPIRNSSIPGSSLSRRPGMTTLIVFPQLEPLNLPRRRLRQTVHHIDPARIFPRADLLLDVLLQRLMQAVGLAVGAQHDEGLRLQQVLPDRPRARRRPPARPGG